MRPVPLLALLLAVAPAGCRTVADARLVSRTPDGGVIAMSRDTPENRSRAEALMRSHFPEGYEVVYEGEEAVYEPAQGGRVLPLEDPMYAHQQRMLDAAYGTGSEGDFQRAIDDLPGTPRSGRGYARDPTPSVGLNLTDGAAPPAGRQVLRDEWRITYRRKGASAPAPETVQAGGVEAPPRATSESLFPDYRPATVE